MPSSVTVTHGKWLDRQHSHSSIGQRIRGRPRGPSWTAPAVDENAGHLAGGGVAVHHDVGIAALLEVRIEERLAGRAPAQAVHLGESLFNTNSTDDMLC